jgi:hypothetical protein
MRSRRSCVHRGTCLSSQRTSVLPCAACGADRQPVRTQRRASMTEQGSGGALTERASRPPCRAKHASRPPAPRWSCGARSRCLARRERVSIGLAACAQSSPILHIAGGLPGPRLPPRSGQPERRIGGIVAAVALPATTSSPNRSDSSWYGDRPDDEPRRSPDSLVHPYQKFRPGGNRVPRSRWCRWSSAALRVGSHHRAIRGRSGDKLGCHQRLLRRSTELIRRARGLIGRGPASGCERSPAAGRAFVESPSSSLSTGPGRPIAKPWA